MSNDFSLETEDVRLFYNEASGEYIVQNILTDVTPCVLHGNGPSKAILNNFGSYVAGAFKHNECQLCAEQKLEFSLVCSVFIEQVIYFSR